MIFKRKKPKPAPALRVRRYQITEMEFRNLIVDYETGKADIVEVLALFSYLVDQELNENPRFNYPWLSTMIDKGIITNDAYVDGMRLFEYYNQ
jgi:hypothetical protein